MSDPEDSDNAYPWRHHNNRRQIKFGLPGIPGVYALSRFEVSKDVQEMEQTANSDTDTDSSIISDEVLVSTYPVKPRKTPKGPAAPSKSAVSRPSDAENMAADYDGVSAEQTFSFFDFISRTNKNLHAAECERELLESQDLSYRISIETKSRMFLSQKKDQCNYIKTMQGLHSQALRLQMSLKRQNTMFYDVYRALQRRKKESESVIENCTNLQNCIASSFGESCMSSAASESEAVGKEIPQNGTGTGGERDTAALRICDPKTEKEMVIFKGQRIKTSMGDALILSIHPEELRVVLQLSFGTLYSSLRQVVTWVRSKKQFVKHDDTYSDDCLRQRWTALHSSGGLLVPQGVCEGICELVGQGEDEPGTDGDEDSANDEAFVAEKSVESMPDALQKSEDLLCGVSAEEAIRDIEASTEGSSCSAPAPALNGELERERDRERDRDRDRVTSAYSFPLRCYPSAAGSSSGACSLSRQSLKGLLCPGAACPPDAAFQPFPLVFAPPAAIPYLIEREQKNEKEFVVFCPEALSDSGKVGSMGCLAWKGDLLKMSRELTCLQDEVNRLENEQNFYVGNIQTIRSQCARISVNTAALRLGTFTKRIRHRNNLNCRMESSAKISLPDSSVASVSPSNTEVHLSSLSNGNGNGNGNGMPPAQESTCRARAVGSEVEVEEVRRSLRGPISASREGSGTGSRGSRLISVTFTGTSLGSLVGSPSLDRDRSPPLSGAKDKDGRPGNGSAGAVAVAVVESSSARKRSRDIPIEVTQQAQPRKRVGAATATALELLRVKESLTAPTVSSAPSSNVSLEYDGDDAGEDSDGQKDGDTDDSPRIGHADPGSKGVKTVGTGAGLMKKKPKRPRRY